MPKYATFLFPTAVSYSRMAYASNMRLPVRRSVKLQDRYFAFARATSVLNWVIP